MLKVNSYTAKGNKGKVVGLPKAYEVEANEDLLAQAIHVYQSRSHIGFSKAKGRGEVKGTSRKIYQQKGTGRARHGARTAPIFVGGGKAHGPDGLKRVLTLPKKMRRKALKMAITTKSQAGQLVVVSGISGLKKSKEVSQLVQKIQELQKGKLKGNKITVALSTKNREQKTLFRNIENLFVTDFDSLNARNVYLGGLIIVDSEALVQKSKTKK